MKRNEFAVVIPVYNSEKTLEELTARISKVINSLGRSFEIIFVNDCSKDNSLNVLKEIKLKSPDLKLTIIDLTKNYGQQNAILCGFKYSNSEYVINLDDDLQNPPEEIPKLITKIEEGYDAVWGKYSKKQDKNYKNLGSILFRKLNHKIFKIKDDLKFSSFRIFRDEIIQQVITYKTTFPYITGIVLTITSKVANIEVDHQERKQGKSNYSLKKLIKLSLSLLVNYSTIPLRIFGYIGIIVSFLSTIIGGIYLLRQLFIGKAPAGWTSLIVLVSFYNALILVIFFILGEYISRILKESGDVRAYSVRDVMK
jgi:polyisoprenyl-phosphate glycosyltransferase